MTERNDSPRLSPGGGVPGWEAGLADALGVTPHPASLFLKALTHPSYPAEAAPPKPPHNQRLEFLGDAVIGLVAAHVLWRKVSGSVRRGAGSHAGRPRQHRRFSRHRPTAGTRPVAFDGPRGGPRPAAVGVIRRCAMRWRPSSVRCSSHTAGRRPENSSGAYCLRVWSASPGQSTRRRCRNRACRKCCSKQAAVCPSMS